MCRPCVCDDARTRGALACLTAAVLRRHRLATAAPRRCHRPAATRPGPARDASPARPVRRPGLRERRRSRRRLQPRAPSTSPTSRPGAQGRAPLLAGPGQSTTPAPATSQREPDHDRDLPRPDRHHLAGPTGGAVLPPVSPPVIRWDSVAGAIGYDVEVDNEGDGVGGTVREGIVTTTRYVWPEPQGVGETAGNEDFYVRVRAQVRQQPADRAGRRTSSTTSPSCPRSPRPAAPPGWSARRHPATGIRLEQDRPGRRLRLGPGPGRQVVRDLGGPGPRLQQPGRAPHRHRHPVLAAGTTYDNNNYFWKVRADQRGGPAGAVAQPTPNVFQRRWPDQPTLVWPPVTLVPRSATTSTTSGRRSSTPRSTSSTSAPTPNFTPGTYETCFTALHDVHGRLRRNDDCMPSQGQPTTGGSRRSTAPAASRASSPTPIRAPPATRAAGSSTTPARSSAG